jgi:DNA-binding response OmpR family regulator
MTLVNTRTDRDTVVIADDDADIRELVAVAVLKAKLELVASAADGIAALAAITEHHPDLAILDAAMPGMNGFDVCRAARQDPSAGDLRILLLSASVDESSRSLSLDAGADYFMPKPFGLRELTAWLSVGKEAR